MTPEQRRANSALKWLKISVKETNYEAAVIQNLINKFTKEYPGEDADFIADLQASVVVMRKSAKRCAYHGLGEVIQPMLISENKKEKE